MRILKGEACSHACKRPSDGCSRPPNGAGRVPGGPGHPPICSISLWHAVQVGDAAFKSQSVASERRCAF